MSTEGQQCQIEGCEGIRVGNKTEYNVTSHIPFCEGCLEKIYAQMAYNKLMKEHVDKKHPPVDDTQIIEFTHGDDPQEGAV